MEEFADERIVPFNKKYRTCDSFWVLQFSSLRRIILYVRLDDRLSLEHESGLRILQNHLKQLTDIEFPAYWLLLHYSRTFVWKCSRSEAIRFIIVP